MSDVWKKFSKAELQKFIGLETLERLETIIPIVDAETTDSDRIYSKEVLSQIFNSFSGPDLIGDKAFRTQLLNHLTSEQLDNLLLINTIKNDALSFEEKVNKIASKGWKDITFCQNFVNELSLPEEFLPVREKQEDFEISIAPSTYPLKVLKDYQSNVFHAALRKLEPNFSRFIIQMPTGSGKTRTAMEIISHKLNDIPAGHTVVWLAHSDELCEQAYECFLQVWPHIGQHNVRVVRCWGTKAKFPSSSAERTLVIGGFPKLFSLLEKDSHLFQKLNSKIDLVVVDEAHKVLAPTYKKVTKALMGERSRVIGLTATPGRSTIDAEENKALADFFFGEIITINAGNDSVINFLRERQVLAKVEYDPLISQAKYELTEKEKTHIQQFFDIPPELLKKIGSDDIRNIEILKKLQIECEKDKRILFFACSVEHSKFICAMLIYLGYKAAHIDGFTSRGRRQTIINQFKKGELQIICNFGVLSTGFDAPKTDVVFISRPTASIVLYSQMIGRGLRGPAIGGTRTCKVIDVKDNIVGFSNQESVYEYFDEYFN